MHRPIIWLSIALLISPHAAPVSIDTHTAQAIGKQIWHNESRCSVEKLTSWNPGEQFASLGTGHFIWYPLSEKKRLFKETFPHLLTFLKKNGKRLPKWLERARTYGCPWQTRKQFLAAQNSKQMKQLRTLLASTIELQTQFIITRFKRAVYQVASHRKINVRHIQRQLSRLSIHPNGTYALVDYAHFKGEGFNESEQYQGHGWGLMNVLLSMKGKQKGMVAVQEFSQQAKAILTKRVALAPPERNEMRWLPGWHNRIDTYVQTQF
ncbi:MAG: hypothetical protein WCE21_03405 [Candidatus Babeliales bacterium]